MEAAHTDEVTASTTKPRAYSSYKHDTPEQTIMLYPGTG